MEENTRLLKAGCVPGAGIWGTQMNEAQSFPIELIVERGKGILLYPLYSHMYMKEYNIHLYPFIITGPCDECLCGDLHKACLGLRERQDGECRGSGVGCGNPAQ